MDSTGQIIVALLGGGAFATIMSKILQYRSENARTEAEGGKLGAEGTKLDAEAQATASDAIQRRYDSLFEAFEAEVNRRAASEAKCQTDLAEVRVQLDTALQQLGSLRVEAANATADVRLARAEIVRLEDRLVSLEHDE